MATQVPAKGDTFEFSHLSGYTLSQDRPLECRHGCTCGECNGRSWTTTETVTDVIYWADNAIDVYGSEGGKQQLAAPSGDACF